MCARLLLGIYGRARVFFGSHVQHAVYEAAFLHSFSTAILPDKMFSVAIPLKLLIENRLSLTFDTGGEL